jgi:hypothetical protein
MFSSGAFRIEKPMFRKNGFENSKKIIYLMVHELDPLRLLRGERLNDARKGGNLYNHDR